MGQGKDILMKNEVVLAVAQEMKQSPAAVLVQWNVQQGVSVVPKCQSQAHMQDLLQERKVLLPTQMERLDALDCGKRMVAPPFMYVTAAFCWHERHPGR
jgi:diketogulonate reductase-like aldo/keto reductase